MDEVIVVRVFIAVLLSFVTGYFYGAMFVAGKMKREAQNTHNQMMKNKLVLEEMQVRLENLKEILKKEVV